MKKILYEKSDLSQTADAGAKHILLCCVKISARFEVKIG